MSLEIPVEVVVLGLIAGLTYALLGVGLTLVYRSSRVLNFAHGELGALPAIIIPVLVINQGASYWLALPAALAASVLGGALMELAVMRKLSRAPRLVGLVATIGVAQLLFALNLLIPKEGTLGRSIFPTPFDARVVIGNLVLGPGQILILIVVPLVTAALTLWLKRSRVGMAARAAADNVDAAQLAGVPVRRVSLAIWTLAGLLAGVSAILVGPTRPLASEVALGPSLMVRALAAAMIGGLVSLPRSFAGGVLVGLVEAVVLWNYPTGGNLELVLFVVVLSTLLLRRRARGARETEGTSWSLTGALRELPPKIASLRTVRIARRAGLLILIAAAAVVALPMGSGHRVLMSSIALFALMGLSLVVLTGLAGQVSLGQFAFVAVGALVGGRMQQMGYPAWSAILYATSAGGLVALVIGLPALRIRGLYLAVGTLAFAVATQTWLYAQDWLVKVEGGVTSLEIRRPRWLGIDFQSERNYYWLCLLVLVVVAAGVHRLRSTGIGRAMIAVRDNQPAAASLSVSPRRAKLIAFVISGGIASLAGYFYGGLLVQFPDARSFSPELSLVLVAMVILGGVTTITGAIAGAVWVQGLGYAIAPLLPRLLGARAGLVLGGTGLLVAVLQFPGGIAAALFRARDRIVTRLTGETDHPGTAVPAPSAVPALVARATADSTPPALEAEGVVVRYGGIAAVDGVDLRVAPGEILGLVGPIGAGKTTLFEVISGHVRPDAGRVLLDGEDVTWMRPEERALLGLGRSFQEARLFDDLTVIGAFKVALEREEPSEVVPSVLGLPPSRAAERRKQARAADVAELLGLGVHAHRRVAELSTGMRRLVELGCMVALGARVLLLDEPTAGIAQREVEAFAPVLRQIRDHLGATMVVIDHDIPMIGSLADRVVVLAEGRVIADGPPEAIRADPLVIAAYLGTDERAIRRSGRAAARVGGTP